MATAVDACFDVELPAGVWWDLSVGSDVSVSLFRNRSIFRQLISLLPSLTSTLIELHPGSPCIPLIERWGDLVLHDAASFPMPLREDSQQAASLSLYLPFDSKAQHEIIIERSWNSIRISFRFNPERMEVRSALQDILKKFHRMLSMSQFLENAKTTTPEVASTEDSLLEADDWEALLCRKPDYAQLLKIYLFRKRPLPTYDLSLVISSRHVAKTSPRAIQFCVTKILQQLEESALRVTKQNFSHCNLLGATYAVAMEKELDKHFQQKSAES